MTRTFVLVLQRPVDSLGRTTSKVTHTEQNKQCVETQIESLKATLASLKTLEEEDWTRFITALRSLPADQYNDVLQNFKEKSLHILSAAWSSGDTNVRTRIQNLINILGMSGDTVTSRQNGRREGSPAPTREGKAERKKREKGKEQTEIDSLEANSETMKDEVNETPFGAGDTEAKFPRVMRNAVEREREKGEKGKEETEIDSLEANSETMKDEVKETALGAGYTEARLTQDFSTFDAKHPRVLKGATDAAAAVYRQDKESTEPEQNEWEQMIKEAEESEQSSQNSSEGEKTSSKRSRATDQPDERRQKRQKTQMAQVDDKLRKMSTALSGVHEKLEDLATKLDVEMNWLNSTFERIETQLGREEAEQSNRQVAKHVESIRRELQHISKLVQVNDVPVPDQRQPLLNLLLNGAARE